MLSSNYKFILSKLHNQTDFMCVYRNYIIFKLEVFYKAYYWFPRDPAARPKVQNIYKYKTKTF